MSSLIVHLSRSNEESEKADPANSPKFKREEAGLGGAITRDQAKGQADMNREAWLTGVVRGLRPHFRRAGYVVPMGTRISVGWPSSGGERKQNRLVGECWDPSSTQDGKPQIFVSPIEFDSLEVAGIIAHELIHASGVEGVHGKAFRVAMKRLGLVGSPFAARPGRELRAVIVEIVDRLGPYPHAAIRL
jgi:hypothetical protein